MLYKEASYHGYVQSKLLHEQPRRGLCTCWQILLRHDLQYMASHRASPGLLKQIQISDKMYRCSFQACGMVRQQPQILPMAGEAVRWSCKRQRYILLQIAEEWFGLAKCEKLTLENEAIQEVLSKTTSWRQPAMGQGS